MVRAELGDEAAHACAEHMGGKWAVRAAVKQECGGRVAWGEKGRACANLGLRAQGMTTMPEYDTDGAEG